MAIDPAARLEMLQEICAREGHGELVDVTTLASILREYICQRGCAQPVFRLDRGMTIAELNTFLERRRITGTVYLRRDIVTIVPKAADAEG
jgi:hypothetical protein